MEDNRFDDTGWEIRNAIFENSVRGINTKVDLDWKIQYSFLRLVEQSAYFEEIIRDGIIDRTDNAGLQRDI